MRASPARGALIFAAGAHVRALAEPADLRARRHADRRAPTWARHPDARRRARRAALQHEGQQLGRRMALRRARRRAARNRTATII